MLILKWDDYKFPILTSAVVNNPDFFVSLINTLSELRKKDNSLNEEELRNHYNVRYTLEEIIKGIWLTRDYEQGKRDWEILKKWVAEVKHKLTVENLLAGGEQILGYMFSHYQSEDNEWSTEEARNIIEEFDSDNFKDGIVHGIRYPSGGGFLRPYNSDFDKKEYEKYLEFSERYKYDLPFVSSIMKVLSEIYQDEIRRKEIRNELEANL